MFTYFVQAEWGGSIKIGRAVVVRKRLSGLQTGSPVQLVCLGYLPGDQESALHHRFRELADRGEWFRPGPALLEFIEKNALGKPERAPVSDALPVALACLRRKWMDGGDGEWIKGGSDDGLSTPLSLRLYELTEEFIGDRCDLNPGDPGFEEVVDFANEEEDDDFDEDWGTDSCQCDLCAVGRSIEQVLDLRPLGVIWRDQMLCLIYPSVGADLQRELREAITDAFNGFDQVGISLNAVVVDRHGEAQDLEIFECWLSPLRRSRSLASTAAGSITP